MEKKYYRRDDNYFEDLTGKRFGRRVVQWAVGRKIKQIMWLCLCDCGKLSITEGRSLRNGGSSSCISCSLRARKLKHKGSKDIPGYTMWTSAKARAKKKNLPFNIEFEDIRIPNICPLLGIPIISSRGKGTGWSPNCPSLDRKIPSLGYVKGNIWVISGKANVMKNDSTIEEMRLLLSNWEKSLCKV